MKAPGRLRNRAALVLLLGGCRHGAPGDSGPPDVDPPELVDRTVSLLPEGRLNHLLPQHVAIDAQRRRLYVTSNAFPTLLTVDLDTPAVADVVELGDIGRPRNGLAVDTLGSVWLTAGEESAVVRHVPETGEVTSIDLGISAVSSFAPRPGGGIVVTGRADESEWIALLDGDGDVLVAEELTFPILGITATSAGELAFFDLAEDGPSALRTLDPDDLSERSTCRPDEPLPHPAQVGHLTELDVGRFMAIWDEQIALLSCDGEPWLLTTVGTENKSAVATGSTVRVFDRLAPEPDEAPLHGVARAFDTELVEVARPWNTGKNTGYSVLDPETGLVWMNSEGTSEVWAIDPDSGEVVHRVGTGAHVETLVTADEGGVAWFTGRLGNRVGRVDLATGTVLTNEEEILWPVAPVLLDGRLYVVTQMTNELVVLDPDTLDVLDRWALDLPVNATLTLDGLASAPERGTLVLTHGSAHRIVEIDPASGAILGDWALTGAPQDDPDTPGHLDVAVHGDLAFVLRSNDGLASRVDLASGAVEAVELDEQVLTAIRYHLQFERLSAETAGGLVFVGGFALDAATFTRDPDADLPVDYVVGELAGGLYLGWRADTSTLRVMSAQGETLLTEELAFGTYAAPTFRLVGGDDPRLFISDLERASIRELSLAPLLDRIP